MSSPAEIDSKPYLNHFQVIVPGLSQTIAFGASSTPASNPITQGCTVIRLFATQNCFVRIEANSGVTATSSDIYVPGGIFQYYGIKKDAIYYIAAIRDTASGSLKILEAL